MHLQCLRALGARQQGVGGGREGGGEMERRVERSVYCAEAL